MLRFLTLITFVSALCLTGCGSLSLDSKIVGTYSADNHELLVFARDAKIFHLESGNGNEKRFLGYYSMASNDPRLFRFIGPDTSVFVGTSFLFSEDFSVVTARWDGIRKPTNMWAVTYRKTGNPK